jgi:hypothetical protein
VPQSLDPISRYQEQAEAAAVVLLLPLTPTTTAATSPVQSGARRPRRRTGYPVNLSVHVIHAWLPTIDRLRLSRPDAATARPRALDLPPAPGSICLLQPSPAPFYLEV